MKFGLAFITGGAFMLAPASAISGLPGLDTVHAALSGSITESAAVAAIAIGAASIAAGMLFPGPRV